MKEEEKKDASKPIVIIKEETKVEIRVESHLINPVPSTSQSNQLSQ